MKKDNKKIALKVNAEEFLKDEALKQIHGSGNSQIRYLPDEFIQTKILNERQFNLFGK